MTRRTIWARSIGVGILAAIAYGVVHDQVTVRISPPYLMDWHPQIVPSRDPTVVALAWGVVATWWFGLILGVVLAASATLGHRPIAPWRNVVRTMAGVFLASAVSATLAFAAFKITGLTLPDSMIPQSYSGLTYIDLSLSGKKAFSQAAAMHQASYGMAGLATLVGAILIFWRRSAKLHLEKEIV